MADEEAKIEEILRKLEEAQESWQEAGQGRVYDVGTKILLDGKFGVVTDLNQGSTDPAGSTVDVRLADGKVVEGVKVSSKSLQFFRG